jgi:hypothetical protein
MRIGEATNINDLVEALEAERQTRLDKRRGYETVWWNNIALVSGDHYAHWNPTLSRYEDRDWNWDIYQPNAAGKGDKKPRLVINHALSVSRTELAKMTKSRPVMDVIANSDEATDIAATKVGVAALDYAEWKFGVAKKRRNALWWMIQTGVGSIFVGYDPLNETSGTVQYTIDPATGEATFNPARVAELEQMYKDGVLDDLRREAFPLGDLDLKVYSPFQLLPDQYSDDLTELQDLITTEILDVDVVKGIYGRAANNIQPDANVVLGTLETRMMARAGIPGATGAMQRPIDSAVRVNTFWLPPNVYRGNRFLKQGVMVRWANASQRLDFTTTFPYQDNRIPHVFFQHIPTSSTVWPDCVISHIRGPNLEIDKTVSQLIENKDYMGNPMWIIATQHKIRGEIKNVAGGIVRYRHVPNIPPPAPVPGLQMPAQIENLIVGLRDQIMDISGQSEVARGRVPTGVRSGVAVAYLQEEDDTKIGPTIATMEESIALMGSMVLERFSQFYSFPRILRFYRRDGSLDVRQFKGADLKNNTDVVCQAGSAMPKMKAARQQYALELATLGIIKDPKKLQEMLELGQGEPDDEDKAVAQADRENSLMMYGVWRGQTNFDPEGQDIADSARYERLHAAVPVKAWMNHAIHIQRHTSVMMDEAFEDLAIAKPAVPQLFDQHIALHQQMMEQQQQAQMQMLQAAKGAPDGPPTPAGGTPPGAAQQTQNGATNTNRVQTGIPDVIGGGTVTATARQIRPQ